MVAAMANVGYQVVGMDIDSDKVSALSDNYQPTIYEPGVAETFIRCRDRINFTDSFGEVMGLCRVVFITVGTPLTEEGDPDIRFLTEAIQNLARYLERGHDEVREYYYPNQEALEAAEENGWIVISMKNDFETVFSNLE